jgi:ribosomal protein L12E/L44/L45/RPP1/RPP2
MTLADQWNGIESGLDPRWSEAQLLLAIEDETRLDRAAALLAPAGPGRTGQSIRITAARAGAGVGPEAMRRLVRRLDEEDISGTLELLTAESAPPAHAPARQALADAWDAALAPLPEDWSDLLCEVELTSSDHLDRGALLLGPVNPLRAPGGLGFRFRVAHSFGYGTAPGMVRRCLTRLDEEGTPGRVRVLRVLSDTHPVGTQGPVWTIGGKAV